MKDATEVSSRVSTPPEVPGPGCCPGCAVPGWVARPGADIGPIPLIRPAWCRPRPVLRTGRADIDTQFESVTREPRSRPAAGTASMVCHRVLVGLDDQVIPEPCPASPRRHRPGNCRTVPLIRADRTARAEDDRALAVQQRMRRHASAPSVGVAGLRPAEPVETCRRQRAAKRGAPLRARSRPVRGLAVQRAGDRPARWRPDGQPSRRGRAAWPPDVPRWRTTGAGEAAATSAEACEAAQSAATRCCRSASWR